MKKTVLLFLIGSSLMGCKELGLKDENYVHQVKNVNRNDLFTVENKKKPAFVNFTIEGDLSHDAKILFSEDAPNADTLFSHSREILIPKGKINMVDVQREYYGKKLYVKYQSLNDSTSGKVQVKVKI